MSVSDACSKECHVLSGWQTTSNGTVGKGVTSKSEGGASSNDASTTKVDQTVVSTNSAEHVIPGDCEDDTGLFGSYKQELMSFTFQLIEPYQTFLNLSKLIHMSVSDFFYFEATLYSKIPAIVAISFTMLFSFFLYQELISNCFLQPDSIFTTSKVTPLASSFKSQH